ncbi:MAG TPA: hydroxyisourate hydrolase [Pyrinomonadaceae bacterium]|nr:hydroxyisourate hydrolase [Pyrinomonadaceae bacterium]
MSAITTHVLDVSKGVPARGVPIALELERDDGGWRLLGKGTTDSDGRLRDLLPEDSPLVIGTYRLTFDTETYFRAQNVEGFYPFVQVVFSILDMDAHYHVPLLLSPYGYSTYRGS